MRGFICGCVLLAMSSSPALAQQAAPAEAYGRLPAVIDAAISPDGTKVALARTAPDGGQAFEVISLSDGARVFGARVRQPTREADGETLRGVGWADDGHATYTVSVTLLARRVLPGHVVAPGRNRLDYLRVGIIDLARGRQYYVEAGAEEQSWGRGNLANLTAPIEGDPGYGRLVAMTGPFQQDVLGVFRVDLNTGRSSPRLRGEQETLDFALDRRGAPVLRFDSNKATNVWRLYDIAGVAPRLVLEGRSDTGAPLAVSGLLADGRFAGVDDIDGSDRQTLFAMDRASGAVAALVAHERYDVAEPIFDPWTHEIVGATIVEDTAQQHFLDPALTDAKARLKALDPSAISRLLNWSRDRTKFLAYIETAADAGGYYVFEPVTNRLRRVALRYPDLTGGSLGVLQGITYPARDRTRIPAYLTLPHGVEPRNLPAVVLVHGGPASRDEQSFDWWASFLASRGYAVVQPNFRGSSGYGAEWQRAGYREWGQLMQSDVEDAAAALVRARIADPARICIVGASYGGYAALAGAALTPERYKCAASIAGVSDLPMMLSNVELRSGGDDSMASDWWRMLIGDRREERERLREISPAYQAARVTAPVLLIHGANDTVVPIAQSRRMEDRLKAAGKPVRLVEFVGEDHGLSDAPTRIQMLRELEAFLGEHLSAP